MLSTAPSLGGQWRNLFVSELHKLYQTTVNCQRHCQWHAVYVSDLIDLITQHLIRAAVLSIQNYVVNCTLGTYEAKPPFFHPSKYPATVTSRPLSPTYVLESVNRRPICM